MHHVFKIDLGPLNGLIRFSFLNYGVLVFLFCVALMYVITVNEPRRSEAAESTLTMNWGRSGIRVLDRADAAWTGITGSFIVTLRVQLQISETQRQALCPVGLLGFSGKAPDITILARLQADNIYRD